MSRARTPSLKPSARQVLDHYGEILAHLVRLTRELTSAPFGDLIAANRHMEAAGTRYSVVALRHCELTDDDRAALTMHREFFALLARLGDDYQRLRDAESADAGEGTAG